MKKLILLFLPLILVVGCSKEPINEDELNFRDGVFYAPYPNNKPYNGESYSSYRSGELWDKTYYKNGKKHGKFYAYHKNEQLWKDGNYKNGEEDGEWIIYDKNGNVIRKTNYKDGEQISEVLYNEDGSIK